MGDFFYDGLPNWIMAVTSVAALGFAVTGALVAWRSLQQQIRESERHEAHEVATRARDVTARWVRRDRRFADREDLVREWGLQIMNHSSTTVYDVQAEVSVKGEREVLPELHTLHPGDMFIQRYVPRDGSAVEYRVKRVKDDVVAATAILSPEWVVHSVSFESEGEHLTWRPRERATRD